MSNNKLSSVQKILKNILESAFEASHVTDTLQLETHLQKIEESIKEAKATLDPLHPKDDNIPIKESEIKSLSFQMGQVLKSLIDVRRDLEGFLLPCPLNRSPKLSQRPPSRSLPKLSSPKSSKPPQSSPPRPPKIDVAKPPSGMHFYRKGRTPKKRELKIPDKREIQVPRRRELPKVPPNPYNRP